MEDGQRKPEFAATLSLVADALDRAAHILEVRGWCQRHLVDERGAVCLDFALALSQPQLHDEVYQLVQAELRRRGVGEGVVWWNDRPGRSRDEVVALLRTVGRRWQPSIASYRADETSSRVGVTAGPVV